MTNVSHPTMRGRGRDARGTDGHRQLWAEVMALAWKDATDELEADAAVDLIRARRDARRWFSQAGKDFREVCSLAGVDPVAVHERYKQVVGL